MATGLLPLATEFIKSQLTPSVDANATPFYAEKAAPVAQAQQDQGWYQMMPGTTQVPQQQSGLLGGVGDFFGDKEKMAKLALAFNSMTMRPDAGIQQMALNTIENAQKQRLMNKTAVVAVKTLRDLGYEDAAKMVESNPSIATEMMKQIAQMKYRTKSGMQTSGVQIDPSTGQMFTVQFDPNTGTQKRVDIEGAKGQTPAEKAAAESQTTLSLGDQQAARERGFAVFGQAENLDRMIGRLSQAKAAIVEGGAQTGIIQQYLPAFDAATAELRTIANQLGIDIINSATFGALSESELRLALTTGLPTNMSPDETVKYIDKKIAAQQKLRNQLMSDARTLTSGIGYSKYIQSRTAPAPESPYGQANGGSSLALPESMKSSMTSEQIDLYNKLPDDKKRAFLGAQ